MSFKSLFKKEKKEPTLSDIINGFGKTFSYNQVMDLLPLFSEIDRETILENINKKQNAIWDSPKQVKYYTEVHPYVPFASEHFEDVVKAIDIQDDETLLDLGCSVGVFIKKLTKIDRKGVKIIGIDYSPNALKQLEKELKAIPRQNYEIKLICQNFNKGVPLPNSSVDKVVSNWGIIYLGTEELNKALGEIKRVLRPGGKFVFSALVKGGANIQFESFDGFLTLIQSLFKKWKYVLKALQFEKKCRGYFPEYSQEKLSGMIERAGLEILGSKYTIKGKSITFVVKNPK